MKFDQIMGSLRDTLNVSVAGDIGLQNSADIITNVSQAMRLPIATVEQAADSARRVGDVLAYAASNSNTDIAKMGITFKYVAPLAAATGMSLEQMAASTMMLANNGIKGSDAGTGLRYALVRMLSPSKKASAAIERLGINLADFITGARAIDAGGVVKMLALDGIDATGMEQQIQSALDDVSINKSPAKLSGTIADMLAASLGDGSVMDRTKLAESLNQTLKVLGTQVDLSGFLNELRKNPDSEALMPAIFGTRHGAKMMALMAGNLDAALTDVVANSTGAADRMAAIRNKGIVGIVNAFRASLENLSISIAKSGVLQDVSKAIASITSSVTEMGRVNPNILKFGAYAVAATAVIAPLGFALSGLASAAALVVSPIGLVAGTIGYLAYPKLGPNDCRFGRHVGCVSQRDRSNHARDDPRRWRRGEELPRGTARPRQIGCRLCLHDGGMGRNVADGIDAVVGAMQALADGARAIADFTGAGPVLASGMGHHGWPCRHRNRASVGPIMALGPRADIHVRRQTRMASAEIHRPAVEIGDEGGLNKEAD